MQYQPCQKITCFFYYWCSSNTMEDTVQSMSNISDKNVDMGPNLCDEGRENDQLPKFGSQEIAERENDCSAVITSEVKGEEVIEPPHTGMLFDSADDFFVYYKRYGNQEGFQAVRRTSKRGGDGNIRFWTFTCAQSGKSRLRGENQVNPYHIAKTGCNAKVSASLSCDGRLRVNSVSHEHNHSLNPRSVKCSQQKREINKLVKSGEQTKSKISYSHSSDSPEMQRYNELCSVASEINNLVMGSEEKSKMVLDIYRNLKEKLCLADPPSTDMPPTDMKMDPCPSACDANNNQNVKDKMVPCSNAEQKAIGKKKIKEETNGNCQKAEKHEAMDNMPENNLDLDSNLSIKDRESEEIPRVGPQEVALEENDGLGVMKSEGEQKEVFISPHPGMLFDSVDDLFEYYKSYGNQEGFQVVKRTTKRGHDGNVRYWTFACARNGKPRSKRPNQLDPNVITKTECSAKISASLCVDGRVRINTVLLEHSHSLSSGQSKMLLTKVSTRVKE